MTNDALENIVRNRSTEGRLLAERARIQNPMAMKNLNLRKVAEVERKFAKVRRWDQFHTPKNLATALMCEAAELAEIFQWLTPAESQRIMKNSKSAEAVRDEIGDVLYYLVRLSDKLGVDPGDCFWEKLEKSAKKYPVGLSRGRATKYTDLRRER